MLRASIGLLLLSGTIAAWLQLPPALQGASGQVIVEGAPVHYTSTGNGPGTVVFVHGWTCDETSWAGQVPEIARTHRVVTIDLPGHGQSAQSKDGVYSMARFAAAVDAVRAQEKIERAVLVGHSMGAVVITRYAQDFPGRAVALVMVDGLLIPKDVRDEFRTTLPAPGADEKKEREVFVKTMFSKATSPEDQQRILKMMMGPSEATARGSILGLLDDAAVHDRAIDVPAYGIFADHPQPPQLEVMKKVVPSFRFEKIAGTGHFLMLEKPAEFNRALLAYLQTLKL